MGDLLHLPTGLLIPRLGEHRGHLRRREAADPGDAAEIGEDEGIRRLQLAKAVLVGVVVRQGLEDHLRAGDVQPGEAEPLRPEPRVALQEALGEGLAGVEDADPAGGAEDVILHHRPALGEIVDHRRTGDAGGGGQVGRDGQGALIAGEGDQVGHGPEEALVLVLHRHGQHVVRVPAHDLHEAPPILAGEPGEPAQDGAAQGLFHGLERLVLDHVVTGRVGRQGVTLDDPLDEPGPRRQGLAAPRGDEHPRDVDLDGASGVDVGHMAVGDAEHAAHPGGDPPAAPLRVDDLDGLVERQDGERDLLLEAASTRPTWRSMSPSLQR